MDFAGNYNSSLTKQQGYLPNQLTSVQISFAMYTWSDLETNQKLCLTCKAQGVYLLKLVLNVVDINERTELERLGLHHYRKHYQNQ